MPSIEARGITPEEFQQEIETSLQKYQENKYAFQVGLKDVDFDIDDEQLDIKGLSLPFRSIDQAEKALATGGIKPATFLEQDGTEHKLLAFDPQPVGYSGFMDCVTHSLALTDRGLFEVGRYPAVNLSEHNRFWQWFLHRCLATSEDVAAWQEENALSAVELLDKVYMDLTDFG
jgi:hypothetical protein